MARIEVTRTEFLASYENGDLREVVYVGETTIKAIAIRRKSNLSEEVIFYK